MNGERAAVLRASQMERRRKRISTMKGTRAEQLLMDVVTKSEYVINPLFFCASTVARLRLSPAGMGRWHPRIGQRQHECD